MYAPITIILQHNNTIDSIRNTIVIQGTWKRYSMQIMPNGTYGEINVLFPIRSEGGNFAHRILKDLILNKYIKCAQTAHLSEIHKHLTTKMLLNYQYNIPTFHHPATDGKKRTFQ